MKLYIHHKTVYSYNAPVDYALQQVRLTPKHRESQHILSWNIGIVGGTRQVEYTDHHNNHVMLVSMEPGTDHIELNAVGEVETEDTAGILGRHGGFAPLWHFHRSTELTKPGPLCRRLVKENRSRSEDGIETLHNLSAAIHDAIRYEAGHTTPDTSAEQALENGVGVCQDHAQVLIATARLLGFPARYVSGYLMMNDRIEQDASHAWAEVHVPDLGWVGFDVSNQISPDTRYIAVATGLDYLEAAPVRGIRTGNCSESMIVSLQVQQ